MLSPAAYLVDLLAWLAARPSHVSAGTALEVLLRRRPGLGTLELSCENTNTQLPYLDLVLEILEGAILAQVAPQAVPARHDTTEGSTDDLVALPEVLNLPVYDELNRTVAPWLLPYDVATDTVRTYLAQTGVTRLELVDTFHPGDAEVALTVTRVAERLALSRLSAVIAGLDSTHTVEAQWGVTRLPPAVQRRPVPAALRIGPRAAERHWPRPGTHGDCAGSRSSRLAEGAIRLS